jgi:CRP-like cAMP-binding protein
MPVITSSEKEKMLNISILNYIFREGEDAKHLYSIIDGKVGLEIEKDSSTRILVDTLSQGRTFGFSALIDTEEKKYTSSAKAITDVKVFF